MTRKEAYEILGKVAVELLVSAELPSEFRNNHPQQSYSAGRLADYAGRWREINRRRGVAISEAADFLRLGDIETKAPAADGGKG